AFQSLAEQFASRSIEKFYTALVYGVPEPLERRIEEPIARHPVNRLRMAVRPEGRQAVTDYRVEQAWGSAALLGLQIHTGRTHQIRVHMKHLGHPLLGDALYGFRKAPKVDQPEIPRVMLHAVRLKFIHPISGEPMELKAPLPEDFRRVIEELDEGNQTDESR
ncbi:MAG: RluA family pseudouridine synthase, partial [Puniceicoccaceae bacterium]